MDTVLYALQHAILPNADDKSLIRANSKAMSLKTNIAHKQSACNFSSKARQHPTHNKLLAAFTMIEILITLCVLSIILTIAAPALHTMVLDSRINSSQDSLVNTMSYARGIALHNAGNIKVCPFSASNSTTCGGDWSAGWVVVTDPTAGTPTLLRSQENPTANLAISSNISEVVFDSHGLTANQGNFIICDSRSNAFARSIAVMTTGYVQSGNTVGQAVWNNLAITCP